MDIRIGLWSVWGYGQTAKNEDAGHGHFLPCPHLELPDHRDGKDEHGKVQDGVDGGQPEQRRLHRHAVAGDDVPIPQVMHGGALEHGREEAGNAPGDEQGANDVQGPSEASIVRREDPAIEKEDGDLGRSRAGRIDGFQRVE